MVPLFKVFKLQKNCKQFKSRFKKGHVSSVVYFTSHKTLKIPMGTGVIIGPRFVLTSAKAVESYEGAGPGKLQELVVVLGITDVEKCCRKIYLIEKVTCSDEEALCILIASDEFAFSRTISSIRMATKSIMDTLKSHIFCLIKMRFSLPSFGLQVAHCAPSMDGDCKVLIAIKE